MTFHPRAADLTASRASSPDMRRFPCQLLLPLGLRPIRSFRAMLTPEIVRDRETPEAATEEAS